MLLRRLRDRVQILQSRARRVELQIAHRSRARFHRRHLAETPRQRQREQSHARIQIDRRLALRPFACAASTSRSIRKRFTWKNELLLTRNSPR